MYDGVSAYVMAISKSTNGGVAWHRDTLTTATGMCHALAVDRNNSNVVYAGGQAGVYKSTNAGGTWFLSSTGLSGTVYDIAISSVQSNTIYAGSSAGVFKSTNAGASWTNTGCTNVNAVLINPVNQNMIFAATSSGVYKSMTAGGNWAAENSGLPNLNTTSLGINPNLYLITGTTGAGMARSSTAIGVEEQAPALARFELEAIPNPAPGRTAISYRLAAAGPVDLAIYDIQGRLVRRLVRAVQPPGEHCAVWDGRSESGDRVPGGVYFGTLGVDSGRSVVKLVITD